QDGVHNVIMALVRWADCDLRRGVGLPGRHRRRAGYSARRTRVGSGRIYRCRPTSRASPSPRTADLTATAKVAATQDSPEARRTLWAWCCQRGSRPNRPDRTTVTTRMRFGLSAQLPPAVVLLAHQLIGDLVCVTLVEIIDAEDDQRHGYRVAEEICGLHVQSGAARRCHATRTAASVDQGLVEEIAALTSSA